MAPAIMVSSMLVNDISSVCKSQEKSFNAIK
jgi:hypothetical protein